VARTPIMGFRDDVVVRIRPEPDGARIDARSSSRYGSFDFGTNAARLRSLLSESDVAPARRTTPAHVQDAYSLRCMPQVHGAVRDALHFARASVEIETGSATDNPLVFA